MGSATNFRADDGEVFDPARALAKESGLSLNATLTVLIRLGLREVDTRFDGDILIARRSLRSAAQPGENQ